MDVERFSARLLAQYEGIRRQEYEQITKLLEVLGRIDGLPADEVEQARDALFHANHPFLVVMVGLFGSGKSSTINALLGENLLEVGPIPTTDHIVILRRGANVQRTRAGDIETIFHPSPLLENLSLVDTPGLESVFRTHDEVTRRFLHRADVVMLVMLATQVLTAGNLEFLQELRAYGKRVIAIVNQVDLLETAERDQVRAFVLEQSRLHLGVEPPVWLVSARDALLAQQGPVRDEAAWQASGFATIETYFKETLGNLERFQQKLETPVQICQNVIRTALDLVQEQQSALNTHRTTLENIEAQIEQGRREQQRTVDETLQSISSTWDEVAARGSEAIDDLFQFSRGIGLFFSGLGEIVGLGRLARRFSGQTRAGAAFEHHKVKDTLQKISQAVDQLGPRLEGRDLQDLDDLVDYTRHAVEELPPRLSSKLIGRVQTPMHYERGFLRQVQRPLQEIVARAEQFETEKLDRTLRNTLIILALWQIIAIVLVVATLAGATFSVSPDARSVVLVFAIGIGVVLLGLSLVPLRGWLWRKRFERQIRRHRDEYLEMLRGAAAQAVAHGVQLRRDATAPFTRLLISQGELLDQQRRDLLAQQQAFVRIQGGLTELAPRRQVAQPGVEGR